MTTYRIFTRSFTALSAILALAIGVAATVAPSTARAESSVFGAFVDDVDTPASWTTPTTLARRAGKPAPTRAPPLSRHPRHIRNHREGSRLRSSRASGGQHEHHHERRRYPRPDPSHGLLILRP